MLVFSGRLCDAHVIPGRMCMVTMVVDVPGLI